MVVHIFSMRFISFLNDSSFIGKIMERDTVLKPLVGMRFLLLLVALAPRSIGEPMPKRKQSAAPREKHEWEKDLEPWPLEMHPAGEVGSDGEEAFDYESVTPDVALQEFTNMVIDLKVTAAQFNARTACVLCFWASKAGLGGTIADLAVAPDRDSGFSATFRQGAGALR